MTRVQALAFLTAALLLSEQLCLGGDTMLIAALFSLGKITLALVMLIVLRPGVAFWRASWPVVLLLLLATLWLAQPLAAPAAIPWHTRAMLAPDLLAGGVTRTFASFALVLAGAWLGSVPGGARAMVDGVIAAGTAGLLVGLAIYQIDPLHVWGYDKNIHALRFSGTMLNANAAACLFGVTAVLGAGRLVEQGWSGPTQDQSMAGILRFGLRVAAVVAALAGCALSESRTVLAATVFIVMALLATLFAGRARILALITVGGVIATGGTLIATQTLDRIPKIGADMADRFRIWHHYWQLADQVRWSGFGPLAFDEANIRGMTDRNVAVAFSYIHSPHNVVIDVLLVGGIPYFVLLLAAAGAMVGQTLASGLHRHRPLLFWPLGGAIVLIGLCTLVDIGLDVPAVAATGALLSGLLWGRAISLRAGSRQIFEKPREHARTPQDQTPQ